MVRRRSGLALLLVGALGCGSAPERGAGEPPAAPASSREGRVTHPLRTRLVLLGTGTPNADPDRSGPAVAVVVDGRAYLVDCGPGVVRRAAAATQRGVRALAPERLDRAFITHLHSDHTVGLPDLAFTPWVLGREAPLRLVGPPGLRAMADHVAAAWAADVRVRLDGLEPANATGHRIEVTEVDADGEVYRDALVRVRALSVPHGSWDHAYAYRFDGPDRSVVISGDTAPSDALMALCDGCDVLVHEAYSAEAFATREPAWQRYHRAFHTSAVDLGRLAKRARPGLLVLYHHLLWGTSPEALVAEVREGGFEGEVRFGRDLDVY
ncbi:MAG: MBL fold metallo-hydrolase [Sandaracinaceae bacterium]